MNKESKPQLSSKEERLLQKFIEKVEQGDETVIARICETLTIDSETRPTVEQIAEFVRMQKRKPYHGRTRN